jgi:hypothetical protein
MGPNETDILLIGGPRVISVFDVHGCCRAQIKHFLGVLIGSRTPYGLGLKLVSRLHRMRRSLGQSIALNALDLQNWLFMLQLSGLRIELADSIQAPALVV